MQSALLGTPVSVTRAWRSTEASQLLRLVICEEREQARASARQDRPRMSLEMARRTRSTLSVVQVDCVPLPSESRYWWTSKTSLPAPAESVTARRAGPLVLTIDAACVQSLPGRRMVCDVAPAARMASTAAWTVTTHADRSARSCGSFIRPKMTRSSEAYLAASWLQREANCGGRRGTRL